MPSPSVRSPGLSAPPADPVVARSDAERLLAVSTDLLLVLDDDGCHANPNPAWQAVLGWAHEDLVGRSPLELVHPDDRERTRRALEALCDEDGHGERFENRCLSKDGSYRRVSWSGCADARGAYAIGRDVTDRREVERMARRHHALLSALRDGVGVLDGEGRILEVCDRLCQMLGFDRGELVGSLPPYPFWAAESTDPLAGALADAARGGHRRFRAVLARKDGTRLTAQLDVSPLEDAQGGRGLVAVIRDMTEHDREHERLIASEAALREAQRVAGMGTWRWDPASDELPLSACACDRTGSEAEATPRTLADAVLAAAPSQRQRVLDGLHRLVVPRRARSDAYTSQRQRVLDGLHRLLDGASDYTDRIRVDVPNPDVAWLELRARPVCDAAGRVTHVHGTVQDVSEQMLATEEARVRSRLLDEVNAAVIATDLAGVVTLFNAGAEQLYGWERSEALGRSVIELGIAPEAGDVLGDLIAAVEHDDRWEGEFEARRKDGSRFPVYARNAAILDEDGERVGFVGVSSDLSERVQAERKLRSARDYLAALANSVADGMYTVDVQGRIRFLNQAAEELLGWSHEELRGQRAHEAIHHQRADGSLYPPDDCPLVLARRNTELVRVDDDAFIRKDGTPLPVAYTSAPIEMEDGTAGAVVVFHDITDQKRQRASMERDVEALAWLSRIRDALDQNRFVLHAQPIIDIATGATVQHELLIRMLDEDGGLVPPGLFLPPAERYGLIREIDRWVIRQAAAIAARGHHVELNISAESLGDPTLYDTVEREVRSAGANPALVVIELTETALLRNEDAACEFIVRVEQLGCRVALDDFGTGYGGFSYIKRLPVDSLKIDVDFVRDLPRNPASHHVVRAIVNLARDFGHHTVAEGVEDDETLDMLRQLGVDFAQGYGIARPAPLDQTALAEAADQAA